MLRMNSHKTEFATQLEAQGGHTLIGKESAPAMMYLRKSKRVISKLVFHHFGDAPPPGTNVRTIRYMHMNRKRDPFKDIGYHGIIMPDGDFQIGRDIDKMGAHTGGHNRGSIGIMFVAGLEEGASMTRPTRAQLDTARDIINEQKAYYPGLGLYGHKDLKPTQCPGFNVRHWYRTDEVVL